MARMWLTIRRTHSHTPCASLSSATCDSSWCSRRTWAAAPRHSADHSWGPPRSPTPRWPVVSSPAVLAVGSPHPAPPTRERISQHSNGVNDYLTWSSFDLLITNIVHAVYTRARERTLKSLHKAEKANGASLSNNTPKISIKKLNSQKLLK